MKMSGFLRSITSAFLLLLLPSSCEIDVGNPHPITEVSTGEVSLALADAPTDSAKHVYLYIASLSVIPLATDGTEGDPVSVVLKASGKIDVLALQGGKSLDLSLAQTLPVGTYSGVILGLEESRPGTIVDQRDEERSLSIPDAGHDIRITQSFVVSATTPLALTLHLDLRRSIQQDLSFEPYASLGRKDQEGSIRGSSANANASEVCAYLRRQPPDGNDRLQPPGSASHGPGHGSDRPEGRVDARLPPSAGPDGNFDGIDNDSACANAFAEGPVLNSAFLLSHLWPGDYQLVFYKADGTRLEQRPQEVRVLPGQNVEL